MVAIKVKADESSVKSAKNSLESSFQREAVEVPVRMDSSRIQPQISQITAAAEQARVKLSGAFGGIDLAKLQNAVERTTNDFRNQRKEVDALEAELQMFQKAVQLDKSKGVVDSSMLQAVDEYSQKLETAKIKLEGLGIKAQEANQKLTTALNPQVPQRFADSARASAAKTQGSFQSVAAGAKQTGDSLNLIKAPLSGLERSFSQSFARLRSIIAGAFLFNVISAGLTSLRNYMYSAMQTNADFMSSLSQLKGNLLTAFYPIYQAILPALQTLINWLSTAAAYVAAFFSTLFGGSFKKSQAGAQDLYNKTAAASGSAGGGGSGGSGGGKSAEEKAVDDNIRAIQKEIKALEKEKRALRKEEEARKRANKQLEKSVLGFDELNVLQENNTEESNAEIDAIDEKIEALQDQLEALQDIRAEMSDAGAGGAGGGGAGTSGPVTPTFESPDIDTSGMESAMKRLNGLFEPLTKMDLSKLSTSVEGLWDSVKNFTMDRAGDMEWWIGNVFVPLTKFSVEEVLPRFITSLANGVDSLGIAISTYMGFYKDFVTNFLAPIAEWTAPSFLSTWDNINGKWKEMNTILANSTVWQDLRTIFNTIYSVLAPILSGLINIGLWFANFTINQAFIDLKYKFKDIESAVGLVAALLEGDFSKAWGHFKDLMINNKIDKAKEKLDNLKKAFDDVKTKITEWVTHWKEKVAEFVTTWVTNIQNWWDNNVKVWFTVEKWDGILKNIGVSLGNALADFVDTWTDKIPTWWKDNVEIWFTTEKWKGIYDNIVTALSNFFTGEDGFVQTWKTKIKDWWDNEVKVWFTLEKWQEFGTSMKDGIVNGFSGVVEGIKGFINKILGGIESLVNGIIHGINKIIEGYNSVASKTPGLPTVMKLQEINIPPLAKGAVIPPNREFLAVLGDQKHGTNIETPLTTMVEAFKAALAEMGGSQGGGTVVLKIDSRELGRIALPAIKREERRVGVKLVTGSVY